MRSRAAEERSAADQHVALRTLQHADGAGDAEPLATRARVAHHERAESSRKHRVESAPVAEVHGQSEEDRAFAVAIRDRVDEGAARTRRTELPCHRAVE